MFGLAIRYLNGWAMAASDGAKKERPEWPPHPDRVFMALAAAWFETGKDEEEGLSLGCLESLPVPSLYASEAFPRFCDGDRLQLPTTSYVPVNDTKPKKQKSKALDFGSLKDAGLDILPEFRSRQERSFPLVVPRFDTVYLIWRETEGQTYLEALNRLCQKVVYVGHSASFVQMWVEENPPEPNLVPFSGRVRHHLRVPGPGRLNYLESRFNRDAILAYAELTEKIKVAKGKEQRLMKEDLENRFGGNPPLSQRPEPGLWQGYDAPRPLEAPEIPGSVFDPNMIVLTLRGRRYPLISTLKMTEALRGLVMSSCPIQPPPEWVSGHTTEGGRTEKPHLALIPLPFVGAEHADGRIMGLSLVLPRKLNPEEADAFFDPFLRNEQGLTRRIRLFNGRELECEFELEVRESPPYNLSLTAWTGPSQVWASVTPVVLDRHFDGPNRWEKAAVVVKEGCERIGLPRPIEVVLQPVSLVEGVPHSREFETLLRKSDGGHMHHTHAVVIFDQPVRGPVIVGAGRYRGYGLFRPLTAMEERNGRSL